MSKPPPAGPVAADERPSPTRPRRRLRFPRAIPPRRVVLLIAAVHLFAALQLLLASPEQTNAPTVRVLRSLGGHMGGGDRPLLPIGLVFAVITCVLTVGVIRLSQRWAAVGLIAGCFAAGAFAYMTGVGVNSSPPSQVLGPMVAGHMPPVAKPLYFVPIFAGGFSLWQVVNAQLMLASRNRNGWGK